MRRLLTRSALGLVLAAAGCTGAPAPLRAAGACGPVAYADVRGEPPPYAGTTLSRFAGDAALCAGWWLPGAEAGFVPQGLAVGRRTAWVAGYDGTRPEGHRTCTVQRLSLPTGRLVGRTRLVRTAGRVCHHGGGLTRTPAGLWLVETHRLWLLSPRTLAVRRMWDVPAPVRGSFLVTGTRARLGIGGFRHGRPARLYWFRLPDVMTRSRLTAAGAASSVRTPADAQGAHLGRIGAGRGLWFSVSSTRCGRLVGPGGARALVPGAEGLQARGGRLYVVSESSSRGYYASGDRPLVPMLSAFDAAAVAAGPAAGCSP